MRRFQFWLICLMLVTSAAPVRAQDRLNVVASFSILGDFVRNVGGERVSVTRLVGADGDVPVYTPAPAAAKKSAAAAGGVLGLQSDDGSHIPRHHAEQAGPPRRSPRLAIGSRREDIRGQYPR